MYKGHGSLKQLLGRSVYSSKKRQRDASGSGDDDEAQQVPAGLHEQPAGKRQATSGCRSEQDGPEGLPGSGAGSRQPGAGPSRTGAVRRQGPGAAENTMASSEVSFSPCGSICIEHMGIHVHCLVSDSMLSYVF